MSKYYIAYGSNLNKDQMKYRCPDAKLVGTGTIHDYQLLFRGGENAVATIEPLKGESVQFGLWEISERDEKSLDRHEGFPRLYYKQSFPIKLNGKEAEAMAYIMDSSYVIGCPSKTYYQTIAQGYEDCHLDIDKLAQAANKCAEAFYIQRDMNVDMRMK